MRFVRSAMRNVHTSLVVRGRSAELALEGAAESAEIREADFEGRFGHATATATQELGRALDAGAHEVLVGARAGARPKRAAEVIAAHAGGARQLVDGERFGVARLDAVDGGIDTRIP